LGIDGSWFRSVARDFKIRKDQNMSNPERIALFIDGANLYASAKSLGFDIDYKRLLK